MIAVEIRNEAEVDLADAAQFYEDQEKGLGAWFVDKIFFEINDVLGQVAGVHRKRHGLHCFISARFPFGVYYRMEDGKACVHAILDLRQNPRVLNRILRKR